ncbi:hypothetical protein FSARC_5429 [Fusarium sarcochroum]|uniref:Uncharacterized protein n=1 Tax=Fusarium sarcochroum TaxID=1208366 RepID=A0A8H4TZL5_9HYPO|nr:hypothetical protein FSARC_5429 [Fusarium sarcochroum]
MDSNSIIIENLRQIIGFTGMRDFVDLGKVRQNRLEQKLSAASRNLSVKNMASLYMAWLFQQISLLDKHALSQVVKRWVMYVGTWGLERTEAITIWAHAQMSELSMVGGAMSWKSERLRNEMKALRQELELQFLGASDSGERDSEAHDFGHYNDQESLTHTGFPVPILIWSNPKDMIYNSKHGKVRKWDEYLQDRDESLELFCTLKNWPTKDIPFPSIELSDDEEWYEVPDIVSNDTVEETAEVPSTKRQKLDVEARIKAALELLENPPQTPDLRTPTPFRLYEPLTPVSIFGSSPPSLVVDASVNRSSPVDSFGPDEPVATSSLLGRNAEAEHYQAFLSSTPSLFDDLAWYC